MDVREALLDTTARLTQAGIPDARIDAEYLVAAASGIPRTRMLIKLDRALSLDGEILLRQWTIERLERRPLAYVLGEQPFLDLTLRVNPSVLIPRPETELVVEEACRILGRMDRAVVVDVGTGSGNIALSLANHEQAAEVHAIDISPAALGVARENALRNAVKKPIRWHQGDLLSPLIPLGVRADLIVANLPYVRRDELPALAPEVRWEPVLALDGGRDGLAYIFQLLDQASYVLKRGGVLLLEIGADQGPDVLDRLTSKPWKNAELYSDLAGLPRIVKAQSAAQSLADPPEPQWRKGNTRWIS